MIYEVEAPDGSILEIEGPDNATDEQIAAFAAQQFSTQTPDVPRGTQQPSLSDQFLRQAGLTGRHVIEGATLGTGKPVADLLGLPQPETGTERVVGDMSQAITGTGGIIAAARQLIAKAPQLAPQIMEWLAANPKLQLSAATGAGAGGGLAEEAGAGPGGQLAAALVGGIAAPGSIAAGKSIGGKAADIAATIGAKFGSEAGAGRVARDVVQNVAGLDNEAKRQHLLRLLQGGTEFVPGASPKVSQALAEAQMAPGSPQQFGGLVRLEKDLTGVSDYLPSIDKKQQQALLDPLERMAGGATREAQDSAQAAAVAKRDATTAPIREAAFDQTRVPGVSTERIIRQIRSIESQPGDRAVDVVSKTLNDVKEKIAEFSKDGFINAKDLYAVRKQIGSFIKKHSDEGKDWDSRRAASLSNDVKGWIDDAIESAGGKDWRRYLSTYADESRGIDKLKVSQAMVDKFKNEQGKITASGLLNVLGRGEDTLLKTSTGAPRNLTLDEVLGDDASIKNAIVKHLAREEEVSRIAGRSSGGASRSLSGKEIPQMPWLSKESTAYNALVRKLTGGADPAVANALVKALANPRQDMTKLLSKPINTGYGAGETAKRAALAAALQNTQ